MGDIPITPDSLAKLTQRDPVTGAMPSSAAYVRPDGTFTPERQALHDSIVTAALASSTPVEDPHMVMLGGGPASGKTEMKDSGMVTLPTNTVENDPDEIKKALPETAPLQEAGDRSWAGVTHEESSYLSARITSASFETSRNMVLDSTGDSTIDKLSAKIDAAHDAGYKVDANYITVHPDTGTERAMARAEKTGREVNEDVVRNTYASISEVFPQASEKFDSVKLFDNNATAGHEGGQPRVSQGIQLIASKEPGGHLTVSDQPKYNQFLSYGRG
jgi:predicted ABC-type ATPase